MTAAARRHRWSTSIFAAVFLVGALGTGCSGHDLSQAGTPTVSTLRGWCAQVTAANDLISSANADESTFTDMQAAYRTLRGTLIDLRASLDVVSTDARQDVDAELGGFDEIATAFISASSPSDAEMQIDEILARAPSTSAQRGAAWIQTHCET